VSEGKETAPSREGREGISPGKSHGNRKARFLIAGLAVLTVFLGLIFAVRSWVLTPFQIPTSSMEPTLLGNHSDQSGDTILVNRLAYLGSGPSRWDVVAFRFLEPGSPPGEKPISMVKRVVGLPGETVAISEGGILINGRIVPKPAPLKSIRYLSLGRFGIMPLELGPREYFVLGDNSYLSRDSRRYGPIPRGSIFGRAEWIIFPWKRRGRIE